ncbi:hypothetical protein WEB32_30440 [Streptomyces netropsis]
MSVLKGRQFGSERAGVLGIDGFDKFRACADLSLNSPAESRQLSAR